VKTAVTTCTLYGERKF